jgi:hypothetical protein
MSLDRMFPADNPVSHVIPNWMRYSGPEYSSPLPLFVSTLDRVSELAVQPVARSSFDASARRSLQCFSRRIWESSFEPRGPRGVDCQPPTLPRGCDLEPFRFPSLRLLASWTAVTFPRSPSPHSCPTTGNDANSPLRQFGHVSDVRGLSWKRGIIELPGRSLTSSPLGYAELCLSLSGPGAPAYGLEPVDNHLVRIAKVVQLNSPQPVT